MDRMVRIGVTYEKATSHTLYNEIHQSTTHFLNNTMPNIVDLKEMDSYFTLCEYLAYVSRKIKNHDGVFFAYNCMTRPFRDMKNMSNNYYYAAYIASAKLAIGSLKMDKMVLENTCNVY
jgi:hypothetical protein